jgi:tripartite-type tricarboxylate transporter receptor subunit TctC
MSTRIPGIALALAIVLPTLAAPFAYAQRATSESFPNRPIRMLIPYPPGGPTDVVGRLLAQRLQDPLGQQFVIDNRAGGSGAIATEIVARANPDGYTMLLGTPGQLVTLPLLSKRVPYDPVADFAPISRLIESPQVLFANPKLPANNVAELIAYAKQRPGAINYASVATGGTGHLGMELLAQRTGTKMVHVPYKGGAPALVDLISGQVQLLFVSLPSVQPHVKAGRVKILATGARKRTAAIPDVPTVSETVPGYDLLTWYGMWYPKRTPSSIVTRMHAELAKVLALPEIARAFDTLGIEPAPSTPIELENYVKAETERWRKVIATAGIRLE